MSCDECKTNERFTFESAMAMTERTIRRLWIVLIILIVLFVGTNIAWIVYESQFETVCTEVDIEAEQDGEGVNIVGGGDISYGPDSQDKN